jgi:hypothetical protein
MNQINIPEKTHRSFSKSISDYVSSGIVSGGPVQHPFYPFFTKNSTKQNHDLILGSNMYSQIPHLFSNLP